MTATVRIALWALTGWGIIPGPAACTAWAGEELSASASTQQASLAPSTNKDPLATCESLLARANAWASTAKENPTAAQLLTLPCAATSAKEARSCATLRSFKSPCKPWEECKETCKVLSSNECESCVGKGSEACAVDPGQYVAYLESIYQASQQCRFYDCTLATWIKTMIPVPERLKQYRERCLECDGFALDRKSIGVIRDTDLSHPIRPKGLVLRATGSVLLSLGAASLTATIPLAGLNGEPTGRSDCTQGGLGNLPCFYNFSTPGVTAGLVAGAVSVAVGLALFIPGCALGCPKVPTATESIVSTEADHAPQNP